MNLKNKISSLTTEIVSSVNYGECFYEKELLEQFIIGLNELKELSIQYYNENQNPPFQTGDYVEIVFGRLTGLKGDLVYINSMDNHQIEVEIEEDGKQYYFRGTVEDIKKSS